MDLIRLIVVEASGLNLGGESWTDQRDRVEIAAIPSALGHSAAPLDRLVLAGRITLQSPPNLDEEGRVLVPEEERRVCEDALEDAANFVSAVNHCAREVKSPLPYVAFLPQSETERAFLEASQGIKAGMRAIQRPVCAVPIAKAQSQWFADRRHGVALLCDALASRSAVGKYRDLIRLFEHGFRLSSSKIGKGLTAFLDFRGRGYSRPEVDAWMRPRNPLSHGDKQDSWPHEADVRLMLPRMEEAAVDVLFNKAVWRSSSSTRRAVWHPPLWTESQDMTKLVGIRGREWRIRSQPLDGFGRYPMDLGTSFAAIAPGWWTRQSGDSATAEARGDDAALSFQTSSGTLRVIEDDAMESGKG